MPIERAMRTTRKGHSQRKAQSQKYYLVVRYRCAVLNSLRAKKTKNKKAVMLKNNTVSQNHECYIKTSEKKAYTKTLHCNRTAIQTNKLDLANNSEFRRHSKERHENSAWMFSNSTGLARKLKFWKWMKSLSVTIRANIHLLIFDWIIWGNKGWHVHLTLIQASETSFWNLTASLITSKSSFTQFWLVVIWLMEELLMTRRGDSAIVNTVVKGTRQPSNHSSYGKQQFCRGNALVRAGRFRTGWKQTLQDQRYTRGT